MSEFKDYYQNHEYSQRKIDYKWSYIYHDRNFWNEIKKYNKKDSVILEIGSWQWTFAYYCKKQWFKKYYWFDLDSKIVNETKQEYLDYNFYDLDIFEHLKKNTEKYDIIFMSHVFEHLSLEEWKKISILIYESLKKWWVWLNSMPNAANPYSGSYRRYSDITHKIIYTDNSFNQILLSSWFIKNNIIHKNQYMWYSYIKRVIYLIWISINKFLRSSIWYLPKIYTDSIISIIKK